jgi:maleylpyruvate isomerase
MTAAPASADGLRRDIDGAVDAHRRLIAAVERLGDADLRRPSALPDWSIGHVLAHLSRNASSHVHLLDAGERGEVADQYAGGAAGRAAEIERDSTMGHAAMLDDLVTSCDALERRWASMPVDAWSGEGRSLMGPVPLADLPFRRWRETEVHHVDLGIGYEPGDWPSAYVRSELVRMERLWASRRPMGLTRLPDQALAATPAVRLAWLMGRATIVGLEPAGIF